MARNTVEDARPEPQITLGDALAIMPEDKRDAIETDVVNKIIAELGEYPAHQIVSSGVVGLIRQLTAVLPDPDYSNEQRFNTSRMIHEYLTQLGLGQSTSTAAAKPGIVKVEFPTRPEDMDLAELLGALVKNRKAYAKLRPHIERLTATASRKADGLWVVPIANSGHIGVNIDVAATVTYVDQLDSTFSRVRRDIDGRRPITLAKALGLDERPLKHPFDGAAIIGPDEDDFDASELDPEFLDALTWARETGHRNWPREMDRYTFMEQVFAPAEQRSPRWRRILEDYQAAKADRQARADIRFHDGSSRRTSTLADPREWSDAAAAFAGYRDPRDFVTSQNYDSRYAAGTSASYERLVREKAVMAGRLAATGSNNDYNGGAYDRIAIAGSNNDINGVVIVNGGTISGSNNDANLLLPPGVRVVVSGSNNDVNQQNMTWEQLARHLGLI